MAPAGGRRGVRKGALLASALAVAVASVGRTFAGMTSFHKPVRGCTSVRATQLSKEDLDYLFDPYEISRADRPEDYHAKSEGPFGRPKKEATFRDVVVDAQTDLNELLRLPNPMKPTKEMMLVKVKKDDGTVIQRPTLEDLRALRPSRLRPVTFTWRDESTVQTMGPKQYDEIIQRLLNAGPADMEELVRANWKMFDQMYFFRIMELRKDTPDERLKQKLTNLEKVCMEIIQAAQEEMRKKAPSDAQDAEEILKAALEEDGKTLLWPLPAEGYARLAKEIDLRAVRAKYADAWFETILECSERVGKKAQKLGDEQLLGVTQIAMERLITEWLRHDDLWEETREGQFLFRLMSIAQPQWVAQLDLERNPLDSGKIGEELKIISESKVVKLPMGSKLQIYAAKYIQGLVEFVSKKDELLKEYLKNKGGATA